MKNAIGKYKVLLFSILISIGIAFAYHDPLIERLDASFLLFFGKKLSQRSQFIQTVVLFILFFVICLFIHFLNRFVLSRIKNQRFLIGVIQLLLIIPMVQFLIICANQVLRRDDYWEIADANNYGFPGSAIFEITHHNGRYLSWGIKSLYSFLNPIPFINILLFLNIILLVTGLSMLSYQMLVNCSDHHDHNNIKIISAMMGSGLTVNMIILASNVWEVWFWGSGTWVYGLSISLCVLCTAMILRLTSHSGHRSIIAYVFTFIICFLACGGSELCTMSLALFLSFLLVKKRIDVKIWDRCILFYLLEVVCCIIFVLVMSGSINSAGEFADAGVNTSSNLLMRIPDLLQTVFVAVWRYTFINVKVLILFVLFFMFLGSLFRFSKNLQRLFLEISVFLVIIAHAVLLLNAVIAYIPSRVVTIPLCWIFSAVALMSFTIGSRYFYETRFQVDIHCFCVLILIISCTFFYDENIELVREIRNSWMERDASLRSEFDSQVMIETCSIPTLGSNHDDLWADPNELYNIAMRMYYRVPAVTATKRCDPFNQ